MCYCYCFDYFLYCWQIQNNTFSLPIPSFCNSTNIQFWDFCGDFIVGPYEQCDSNSTCCDQCSFRSSGFVCATSTCGNSTCSGGEMFALLCIFFF